MIMLYIIFGLGIYLGFKAGRNWERVQDFPVIKQLVAKFGKKDKDEGE